MQRTKELQKRLNTLVLRMQFFCLDPQWNNFKDIGENAKVRLKDEYDIWSMAALSQYYTEWKKHYDNELLADDLVDAWKTCFDTEYAKLMTNSMKKPTSMLVDKLWYVFFATGKYEHLENIFIVIGDSRINKTLAEILADQFATIMLQFNNTVEKLGNEYFENYQLVLNFKACGESPY